MKKGIYLLPNLLTSGSMFLGFYAILHAFKGDFTRAAMAIMLAAILDGLDGRVARLTKTESRFGVEYDSLADLISFGVAPAVLAYTWALKPFGRFGWLAAFLFLACGALRLARFNVQVNSVESSHFIGLPIPAAAGTIATLVLFIHRLHIVFINRSLIILLLVYILAFLMVSSIRFYSFKKFDLIRRKPFSTLVLAVLALVVIISEPEIMLFAIFCLYILSGPAIYLHTLLTGRKVEEEDVAEEFLT
ncbi:MAG: CDP-diacylglycerol--serine O-phosphatidyltransferase [Deltaproteobacteria bacterium]|nr:MAG: CDP-diacylglycerol--serine O-phosphatidyltransferase [Deltaproteobacteria bacterium]